jgi:hypothetical protein
MVNGGTETNPTLVLRSLFFLIYQSCFNSALTHLGSKEGADTAKESAAANTHRPNHGGEELAAVDEDGAETGDDGRLAHQGQAGHQAGRIPAAGGRRCRCRCRRPDKGLDADNGDADGAAQQEVGDERAAAAETA